MPSSRHRRNYTAAADTETVPRAGPRAGPRRRIPAPAAARPDRPPLAAFTTDDAIRARPPPNPARGPVKRIPPRLPRNLV